MPDNSAAYDWLKNNPDDPRAFSVMSKLANSGEYQLTPESKQAYDWSVANPSHPKTQDVKRKILTSGLVPMQRPEPEQAIGIKALDYVTSPIRALSESEPLVERIPVVGPLARKSAHAIQAGLGAAKGAILDKEDFGRGLSERYGSLEEESAKRSKALQEKYPMSDAALNMAAGAVLPVPGTPLLKAAPEAGALIKAAMPVANIGAKSALQYGINRADVGMRGGSEAEADKSGKLAAGITAAAESVPVLGKLAGRYVSRYVFGVTPKLAKKYL